MRIQDVLARRLLRNQFPSIPCTTITPLGEDYDSVAFCVDKEWVFRFPKRAEVASQLQSETQLLQHLAAEAPIAIPSPQFFGEPATDFPFPFCGYRYIPGVPSNLVDVHAIPGQQFERLGRFLSWLHALPRELAEANSRSFYDSSSTLEECRAEALETFHDVETAAPEAPLDIWFRYLRDEIPESCTDADLVVVHSDMAAEHILFDSSRIEFSGIIDWSDAGIGDPALDISAFVHWGSASVLAHAMSAYDRPVNEALLRRAHYFAAARGVADVTFGLERGRTEYVVGGLKALGAATGMRATT